MKFVLGWKISLIILLMVFVKSFQPLCFAFGIFPWISEVFGKRNVFLWESYLYLVQFSWRVGEGGGGGAIHVSLLHRSKGFTNLPQLAFNCLTGSAGFFRNTSRFSRVYINCKCKITRHHEVDCTDSNRVIFLFNAWI